MGVHVEINLMGPGIKPLSQAPCHVLTGLGKIRNSLYALALMAGMFVTAAIA